MRYVIALVLRDRINPLNGLEKNCPLPREERPQSGLFPLTQAAGIGVGNIVHLLAAAITFSLVSG